MPLGRSVAHKICVSALELAKTLISKEALKSFQRGVGFFIRWQTTGAMGIRLCKEDFHCALTVKMRPASSYLDP